MAFRHNLVSGKAAFADLASRESHCSSARRGGWPQSFYHNHNACFHTCTSSDIHHSRLSAALPFKGDAFMALIVMLHSCHDDELSQVTWETLVQARCRSLLRTLHMPSRWGRPFRMH